MPPTPNIVLASSSPYRRQLLERLGIDFITQSPEIDESILPGENTRQLARRLALEKARAVANHHADSLVIGCDQAAALQGQTLGKPGTEAQACRQLEACSGQVVVFYTGLCLITPHGRDEKLVVDEFRVRFRSLSTDQIQRYVSREQALDCAGSFKVEGLGISLFEGLQGNDPNSLVGLPLIQLVTLLNEQGVAIP